MNEFEVHRSLEKIKMTTTKLPELPEPLAQVYVASDHSSQWRDALEDYHTPEQMRAYGEACRATAPGRDGFVMVPVEATKEMRMAWDSIGDDYRFHEAYAVMLAAAPAPRPADPDFVRSIES